jgi:putative acetyltransferase
MSQTKGSLAAGAAVPAAMTALRIEDDDLTRPAVIALLREHLQNMDAVTPAESVHALDLDALRAPEVTFWSVWDGDTLVGCGALKELDARHGEIKSMRTPEGLRRRGAGRAVLAHILEQARRRGYARVSLETGATAPFEPARRLYESCGFTYCGRFADYTDDPHSVFMTRELQLEPTP